MNLELDKSFVKMSTIKDLGEHKVIIQIAEGLQEEITVNVTAA